ncbi:TPA: hypothetical protein ACP7T9_004678 [Escherichia coli]|nr:hypothetical protein [Escherichia coli]
MKLMPLLATCSRSDGRRSPGRQTPEAICSQSCSARRWYFFILVSRRSMQVSLAVYNSE